MHSLLVSVKIQIKQIYGEFTEFHNSTETNSSVQFFHDRNTFSMHENGTSTFLNIRRFFQLFPHIL